MVNNKVQYCSLPDCLSKVRWNLSLGTDIQLFVVMLEMLVTSVNLRQVHSYFHSLVRMYQSKLWTGVEIRQQTGKGEGGQIELSFLLRAAWHKENKCLLYCIVLHGAQSNEFNVKLLKFLNNVAATRRRSKGKMLKLRRERCIWPQHRSVSIPETAWSNREPSQVKHLWTSVRHREAELQPRRDHTAHS